MLRENIILLMMLDMIDYNRKQLEGSFNTLKPLFLMTTDRLIDLINADIIAIKKQFRIAKIKWWENGMSEENFILLYRYVCHGFEDTFSITRDVAKTQLSIKFGEYFARVMGIVYQLFEYFRISNNYPGMEKYLPLGLSRELVVRQFPYWIKDSWVNKIGITGYFANGPMIPYKMSFWWVIVFLCVFLLCSFIIPIYNLWRRKIKESLEVGLPYDSRSGN